MTNPNAHVEDYLNYYLNASVYPEFAILLQGKWGCGKTWFIKEFTKKYSEKDDKFKFLYISLYGVSSFSEIEDKIFELLHPLLSSRGMQLTGKILKGMLRAGLKIDWNEDKIIDINSSIPDLKLSTILNKSQNHIFIFDDLERCEIDLNKLLGFINTFVEHDKLKVLLIANEDELNQIEKESDNSTYKKIKEKLIGKTLHINHDVESACDAFINILGNQDIKTFLLKNKSRIIDVFKLANYQNLRHLKQSLWDFERFYYSIPDKFKSIPGLMEDVLDHFMAFSIELKTGKINPSDLSDLKTHLMREVLSKENKAPSMPIDEVAKKYSFFSFFDMIIPENYWVELFDKGYLLIEDIEKCFENSRYCRNESTPDWVKLWHFRDLEDREFDSLFQKVNDQWNKRKFKIPGEILHVSGLYLFFSLNGLSSTSVDEIISCCKKYIDDIRKEGNLHASRAKDIFKRRDNTSWNGLGFAGNGYAEFDEIRKYLDTQIDESETESYPQRAKEFLRLLENDPEAFRAKIYYGNTAESTYCETPIFEFVDVEEFFNAYMKLSNEDKRVIIYALEKRYEFHETALLLYAEMKFLRGFHKRISDYAAKNKGKISGYVLEEIGKMHLGKTIDKIESIKEKENMK